MLVNSRTRLQALFVFCLTDKDLELRTLFNLTIEAIYLLKTKRLPVTLQLHLLVTPSFFNKQLLYKQQGFKNLQIKQSEGFKI